MKSFQSKNYYKVSIRDNYYMYGNFEKNVLLDLKINKLFLFINKL